MAVHIGPENSPHHRVRKTSLHPPPNSDKVVTDVSKTLLQRKEEDAAKKIVRDIVKVKEEDELEVYIRIYMEEYKMSREAATKLFSLLY